jgi:hypothetical protein
MCLATKSSRHGSGIESMHGTALPALGCKAFVGQRSNHARVFSHLPVVIPILAARRVGCCSISNDRTLFVLRQCGIFFELVELVAHPLPFRVL